MLEFKTVAGNMTFTTTAINFADIYAGMHTVLVKNLLTAVAQSAITDVALSFRAVLVQCHSCSVPRAVH
eukprot:10256-Heterococcus_DN1.PRE.1